MDETRPYDPTIFQGAAVHYRPGRLPYSPELEAVLARELALDGRGRLLNEGCGPDIPDLIRDSESVLSGYLSFSSSAPHLFGDRVEDFAHEAGELLRARSQAGVFWHWPGDTGVVLARKPR